MEGGAHNGGWHLFKEIQYLRIIEYDYHMTVKSWMYLLLATNIQIKFYSPYLGM